MIVLDTDCLTFLKYEYASVAQQIHDKAKHINALAMNTFVHVHQSLNDVSPMVVGTVDQAALDAAMG